MYKKGSCYLLSLADVTKVKYCGVELNEEHYKAFVYAVKNHYWYQMYIDDLPIWGIVGEMTDNNYYIWTHKKFEIGYNGNQIVDVNITSEDKVVLNTKTKIDFTYEVTWKKSDVKFEDRFDKYLDPNFFQHRVKLRIMQWFETGTIWVLGSRYIGSASSTAS